jgi:hypothetical protein
VPKPIVIGNLPSDIEKELWEGRFGRVIRDPVTEWAITWRVFGAPGDHAEICVFAIVPPDPVNPTAIWCGTRDDDDHGTFLLNYVSPFLQGHPQDMLGSIELQFLRPGSQHGIPARRYWFLVEELYCSLTEADGDPVWLALRGVRLPNRVPEL